MILGFQVEAIHVIVLGVLLGVLLVFQVLQGLRKIKFKGKTHLKVHKFVAWLVIGLGLVHGLLAFAYFYW